MSKTVEEHRAEGPQSVCCAVITISDTRTLETDKGGDTLIGLLTDAGHTLADRQIIPDDSDRIRLLLTDFAARDEVDTVLLTGGTGVGSRDQTFETVASLLTKTLPGYGELFRMLSYEEIGAAAMLSRAIGGLLNQTVVMTMPGSPAAVRLAMEKLIVPELGHLVREARK